MTSARILSLLIATSILAGACTNTPLVDVFVPMPNGWHADSVLQFPVKIVDASLSYSVTVKMRHNGNYPYSNIYMFRKIESAKGIEYQDTVNFVLADPTGKWLGSGVGELKTMVWAYRANALKFSQPGNYVFSLAHGMRADVLPGIENVGLEVIEITQPEQKNGKK